MILKNIIILLLILVFTNCNSTKLYNTENHIIEITEIKSCEDKDRSFHIIRIKKDSTITIWGIRNNENLNDTLKAKTNPSEWNKLISTINNNKKHNRTNGSYGLDKKRCHKDISYLTDDNNYHIEAYLVNPSIIKKK